MSSEYSARLQEIFGFKVNPDTPPLENGLTTEQLLGKLMKGYAYTKHQTDPFGRRKATPLEIKRALDKSS